MNFPIEPELITEQIAADASNRNKTTLNKIIGYEAPFANTKPWYGQWLNGGVGAIAPAYNADADIVCTIPDNGTAYRSELAIHPNVDGAMALGYYMRRKGLYAFDMTISESCFELANDVDQFNVITQLFPVTANTENFMAGPAMSVACRPNNTAWLRLRKQTGAGTGTIVNFPGSTFSLAAGRHQFAVWYDMDAGFCRLYIDGGLAVDVDASATGWGYTTDNIYANNFKLGLYAPLVLASVAGSEGIHPERTVIVHGTKYLTYSRTWPIGTGYNVTDFSDLYWVVDEGGVQPNDTLNLTETITGMLTLENSVTVEGVGITSATSHALNVNAKTNVNLIGLTLSGGSTNVLDVDMGSPSASLFALIDGCTVQSGTAATTTTGIYINGSDAVVRNCTVQDVNNRGIEPRGNRTLVTGNFLQRCSLGTTGAGSIQIDGIYGDTVTCSFNYVDRTDLNDGYCFYANASGAAPTIADNIGKMATLDLFEGCVVATDPAKWYRNKFEGAGFCLWYSTGGTGSTGIANRLKGFARHGIFPQDTSTENYQNTVDASNGQHGIRCDSTTGTVIKNNIFFGGSQYGIRGEATTDADSNCAYDFAVAPTTGVTDANLITDDPKLINPSADNYHLNTDSPCIRAGVKWWTSQADQPQGQDGLRFPLSAAGKPDMGAYPVREDAGYARKAYAVPVGVVEAGVDIAKARTI